jgi:hypothetical protein
MSRTADSIFFGRAASEHMREKVANHGAASIGFVSGVKALRETLLGMVH